MSPFRLAPTAVVAYCLPMPKVRDEAVCIRRWDFSETSQTVSLFCREQGLLRGLAKGAKREKGQFAGGIELLTRGEVLAVVRKERDLATITDWSLLEIYPALSRSLTAHRAGLYFADLLAHLLHEADPHPRLYDRFVASLRALDQEDAVMSTVLDFQWTLLVEAGYRPILNRDAVTGEPLAIVDGAVAFSPDRGGTVSACGANDGWRVRAETIALLGALDDTDATGSSNTALSNAGAVVVDRANRLLAAYIRHLLDRELPTMRHLLGDLHASTRR